MKILNLLFLLLSVVMTSLMATPSYSHVIPEDELRKQVYLTTNEALKKVFEGDGKSKEKSTRFLPPRKIKSKKSLNKN